MERKEIEDLFQKRELVGKNLREVLKRQGYTKISFSKAADISRPTLNGIIDGKINSMTTFEKHICKILKVLDINKDELVKKIQQKEDVCCALYSCNQPVDYLPTKSELEMKSVIEDLLNLCEIYC